MEVNITLLHQQSFYQGKSTSFGITTKYNEEYRHDAEKRDFVACGSAAGVAAAFGSPSKI
jgi:chloride channel 7